MSKKGFSLIEILITLGILGIMTGIATVSYQGYKESAEKMNLKRHGLLFAAAVKNCMQSAGGWAVDVWDDANDTMKKDTPCEVKPGASLNDDLKKKLDFTCPSGATCDVHTHGNINSARFRYHCISIKKKVSGKKLQVITRVSYDDPSNYQILCGGDMSQTTGGDYMPLGDPTCKSGKHATLTNYGFTTQEKAKADRKIIFCQWK